MSLRIAIVGASGRMGTQLLRVLPEFPDLSLGAALVSKESKSLGLNVPGADFEFSNAIEEGIVGSDLVIDFSAPVSSLEAARIAACHRKPILIGTTGLVPKQVEEVRGFASKIAIALISNTSMGIATLTQLTAEATRMLGPSFDIEILEAHHRFKKDAPSGTALALAEAVQTERALTATTGRSSKGGARANQEVGIESLRGGDVVGEHTVFFLGEGERIELTHRVSDRGVFARGAFRFASLLATKSIGFYSAAELLGAAR